MTYAGDDLSDHARPGAVAALRAVLAVTRRHDAVPAARHAATRS